MRRTFITQLICPSCRFESLTFGKLADESHDDWIETGLLLCSNCSSWYPIIFGVPLLLAEIDLYSDIRNSYYIKYSSRLGLRPDKGGTQATPTDKKQVDHYDTDSAVYDDLVSNSIFWQASDWNTLYRWIDDIDTNHITLDMGCGTGRCTIPLVSRNRKVISFDISLSMILAAKRKCSNLQCDELPDFFVGNACNIPLKSQLFDNVISFGVLHHVDNPLKAIQEPARLLRTGGTFYGLENNASIFRPIFDIVMRMKKLWNEEAGSHPCLYKSEIQHWAALSGMASAIKTSTFILPHLFNALSLSQAKALIASSDKLFGLLPILKDQGGQLVICLRKE